MARLDIRKLKGSKARVSLVVELQSDYMRDIPTILVAPVVSTKRRPPYEVINPVIEVAGELMAIRLEEMAGVPVALLGDVAGSASHAENSIAVAINRLLFYV
jgi:toxin CcdB